MKIRNQNTEGEKIELQMTPMIDIVFQLLVFFIMTFKIVSLEGDFNIRMPLAAQAGPPQPDQLVPIKVKLTADSQGGLNGIRINERNISSFDELHAEIAQLVDIPSNPNESSETEVELDCDYDLNYSFVIAAITAVSGHRNQDGDIVKLVEKISFSQPNPPAGS